MRISLDERSEPKRPESEVDDGEMVLEFGI